MTMIRTYSQLIKLPSFAERFEYLRLDGFVGDQTFGSKRYLNQVLYTSDAWRHIRDEVIIRDEGCDLAFPGNDIGGLIYIHHLNPITIDDIKLRRKCVFDLENLVCVSRKTHEAIHYGDASLLRESMLTERTPGDTRSW